MLNIRTFSNTTYKSLFQVALSLIALMSLLSVMIILPSPVMGQAQILDVHQGLPDVDVRTESLAPSADQLATVSNLGANAEWNQFGTVHSLIKYGDVLASGLSGEPAAAAREWVRANRSLFRLSESSVSNLELLNDSTLTDTQNHVVLFRQRIGDVPVTQDGLITVLIGDGKVYYVSSSAVGDKAAPGAATITAAEAWLKAAADIGRNVPVSDIMKVAPTEDWNLLQVVGFSHPGRARLTAFPTTDGVRPAYETIVLDVQGGAATAYTHFIDAQTGEVLKRINRTQNLAETTAFQGTYSDAPPGPKACGPRHIFTVAGTDKTSIVVTATAAIPTNDIVLILYGPNGNSVATADLATSPETIDYAPQGGIAPGTYQVEVCPYSLSGATTTAQTPPYSYVGNFTVNDTQASADPYPPKWRVFTANPLLTYPALDNSRILACWETVQGCDFELNNIAARAPWDHDVKSNTSTFTTIGNAAMTAESWGSPFTPSTQYRPVSATRTYDYPFTNQWLNSKCDQSTSFSALGNFNDRDAATSNLFAMHNRFHNWSYFLGFTEKNYNMQTNNFGNTPRDKENDQETGNVQAGAVSGGAPSYLGRDNANQITLNDGIPGITNMYLWQPIAAAFYAPCVDGDYDMAVIGHEYTHAISNRMVAGPDSGLSGPQAGAMGESYSDLNAVEYLFEYGFAPTNDENPFSVGAYVTGNKARGIRNYGMDKSPLNYSNVGYDMTGPQVHADGEIWSATNFAIRQALIEKYNSSFPATDKAHQKDCADGKFPASQCAGNRRWIQIMYDAFLLMPSRVSMLDSRDAYLAADMARFGGANQKELWRVFASRGMGEFANSNTNADGDPVPNFESKAEANEATIKFVANALDEGNAAITNAKIYVGRYEARSTQIADTNPETTVDSSNVRTKINSDTAKFVPGTYDFVVQAPGYGMQRFTLTFAANETKTVTFALPTNQASVSKGAVASGNGTDLNNLIDDTENTVWASLNSAPVAGKQVTVDLAGGLHTVTGVNVSALLSPTSGGRFTALRQFEVWTCNTDCGNPANFTKIFTSPADAFPGEAPRPAAPDLIMRSFAVPATQATHVQLRVVSTQCTGNPRFAGEQDNDPTNNTDCTSSASGDDVRATEFQVFSQPAPAAPSNLTATGANNSGINNSRVTLNWSDNSNNEQNFEIYRSTTSSTSGFGLIATVGAGVTAYKDQNVLSRATYHYFVRAVNVSGASNPSNTASVTVK